MDYEIVETESFGQITESVVFDLGNGEFASYRKDIWDAQQAAKQTGTIS